VDLFLYTPSNRQSVQLTQDIYDDRDVRAVELFSRPGLLFASNRPDEISHLNNLDTTMRFNKFNLFFQDLSLDPPVLHQLTWSEDINIREPALISENVLLFLTDESGVHNLKSLNIEQTGTKLRIKLIDGSQFIVSQDSLDKMPKNLIADIQEVPSIAATSESAFMSNHLYNLLTFDLHPGGEYISELFYTDETFHIIEHPFPGAARDETPATFHNQLTTKRKKVQPLKQPINQISEEEIVRSRDDPHSEETYLFQAEWEDIELEENTDSTLESYFS